MPGFLTATVFGVGLLAASTSFAQTSGYTPAANPAATIAPNDLFEQDASFIKAAAAGGMAEVALSKLAEKSANPEVKHFAEQMVQDHTKANTELSAITTEAGAEMPKTLDTDHQKLYDQLRSKHGRDFDQQYMQLMVDDHDQAVKLFRQEESLGHQPQLREFAHKSLPTIGEHRRTAVDSSRRLSETAAR